MHGPTPRFACTYDTATTAFTGADATASAIGWEGNQQGVATCLGGSFVVQDGRYQHYGFGIYDGARTTWADADGYLPAQITSFHRDGAAVTITEFADRVVIGGDAYVAVYCRVAVANPTALRSRPIPHPRPAWSPSTSALDTVAPHTAVHHDYVVASDRFGHSYPWPSARALAAAGGFTRHFAHMERFWNSQLATIARIGLPDSRLVAAYKSGFIYTQIARSGNDSHSGVNGYEQRVQPRRHRHPHQPIHPGLLRRRPHTAAPGPRRGRDHTDTVRRRHLDLLGALGHLPHQDRGPAVRQGELRDRGPGRGDRTQHRGHGPRHRRRPAPAPTGSWGHRSTSTPWATGPPTTTRPCWAWPPTATWPSG